MINPFIANINKADVACQEELLKVRHDEESKFDFYCGVYVQLWQNQKMPNLYPNMWKICLKLLITFPISYLVEEGFSAVNQILTKKRNVLGISEIGDNPLMLTKIKQDIWDLISKHQPQGSHRNKGKHTIYNVFMMSVFTMYSL